LVGEKTGIGCGWQKRVNKAKEGETQLLLA